MGDRQAHARTQALKPGMLEPASTSLTGPMIVSGLILAVAYALIFAEVMHRMHAAIIGAVAMVGIGLYGGFYTQEQAIQAIDANTMLLLAGMMMMVALLRQTGGFEYLAIRIAKRTASHPRHLLVSLALAVSVISMFLDNVTTVIIFAPLTVLICRMVGLNPMPYLMAEAMMSNIGGIATLVGDPPNIMIGSAAGIDFNRFLWHMGPMVAVIWCATVTLLLFRFRRELATPAAFTGIVDLDETRAITDPRGLRRGLAGLALIIALFFVHHHLHIYPAYATFVGLALVLVISRPDPDTLLRHVEWSVLLFFAALFVIVGGVESSGLLALIGQSLASIASDPELLLISCLLLMWVAALLSAIIDNIPFTVTMIPIVLSLESSGVNVTPMWWALALGVGLGGNGSHIGATANIICVSESERSGIPGARITPGLWLRHGFPSMLASLVVASLGFAIFFDYLS
jgi:Na+/H+ antiporter NhaD/arsenite permease-like protein